VNNLHYYYSADFRYDVGSTTISLLRLTSFFIDMTVFQLHNCDCSCISEILWQMLPGLAHTPARDRVNGTQCGK